jgi:hypothetical protein
MGHLAVANSRVGKTKMDEVKRVTIRIPADLYNALWRHRERTHQSLNDLLIEAIANLVGTPVPQVRKGIPGPKPKRKKT